MGILIKVIESQSCTSIIPSEWGPGKTKKQARYFSISSISKISSTQEPAVPTDGMKAQSCAVQRDNSLKLSVDECARCWSLFSIHPLAVQGRNESHWKEGSSWRMKEKPTLAGNDKSCSSIQLLFLPCFQAEKVWFPKPVFSFNLHRYWSVWKWILEGGGRKQPHDLHTYSAVRVTWKISWL